MTIEKPDEVGGPFYPSEKCFTSLGPDILATSAIVASRYLGEAISMIPGSRWSQEQMKHYPILGNNQIILDKVKVSWFKGILKAK
jgi:hypothetical protein